MGEVKSRRTDKFLAETGRRRIPGIVWLLGICGLALAGVLASLFWPTGDPPPREEVKELLGRADLAMRDSRPKEAIAHYRRALELCAGHEELSATAASIRKSLASAEEMAREMAELEAEWEKRKSSTDRDALQEFRKRASAYPFSWLADLDRRIEEMRKPPESTVAQKAEEIRRRFLSGAAKDFAGAAREWGDFRKGTKDVEGVDQQVKRLCLEAHEACDELCKSTDAAVLEAALPRFDGVTFGEKKLGDMIRARIAHLRR